jgi:peptidoglycan/xylan/chitin deacetylase (PgdA/CDA1 family)
MREIPPAAATIAAAREYGPQSPWRRMARAGRSAYAAAANRLDPPVVLLAYHRITRLECDPQALAVWPERFAQHLERLRARFPILGFDRDWFESPRPAVVLTFDDGYADNLHEALPALERFEAPATFFVATGPIERAQEFWWDALERCLLTSAERPPRVTLREGGDEQSWPTATPGERRALYDAWHPRLKRLAPEARDAWLEDLRRWSGEPAAARASHRPLTVDEVRRLGAGVLATLGAHTVSHPVLASLPPDRQRQELAMARATLERWLGRPVTVASFPFGGRGDFDATSLRLTREAGYARNATNVPRCAHRWSDPLRLPRHLVRNWDGEEFDRRLTALLRM